MAEDQVFVKLPNALTYAELIGEGKTPAEAKHIMDVRVFGHNYKSTPDGIPIEQGRGSAANPTSQHKEALRIANERAAHANPNNADVIAQAVAAGVKAGLTAAKDEQL